MQIWHIWIIFGIMFFVIEVFTPGFFFASLGVGAFVASIAAYYEFSLTAQICSLTVGTFVVFIGVRPILETFQSTKSDKRKIGVEALIGRKAIVVEYIDHKVNKGRIKIGGEEWKACCIDECDLEKDSFVIVEKIEGVTAFVKPIKIKE